MFEQREKKRDFPFLFSLFFYFILQNGATIGDYTSRDTKTYHG